MACKICSLKNASAREEIERALLAGNGSIAPSKLTQIASQFSEDHDTIVTLEPSELDIHWKFHMAEHCIPAHAEHEGSASLADDIGKDEAAVLHSLLGTQLSTFNALTKRINDALSNEDNELNQLIINPTTVEFYEGLGKSIRGTVAELRALQIAVNGEKSGAAEGLKALAAAIVGGAGGGVPESSTTEYDDD